VVLNLESLSEATLDDVVLRVEQKQARLHANNPLICAQVDADLVSSALWSVRDDVLVARRGDVVVGHLRGITLENDIFGRTVWINPEGLSYDDADVLEALYVELGTRWLNDNVTRHVVWVPDDPREEEAWRELAFARWHRRGVLDLSTTKATPVPEGYRLRRGSFADIDTAIDLDSEINRAEARGPSFVRQDQSTSPSDEWEEILTDPDVEYRVVEYDGVAVAQCASFGLPQRIGSFPATIHVSAVSVREPHRRRGVATSMVLDALASAREQGFTHGETNWRVTNRVASRYWPNFGFTPTYVRLQRSVGRY